MKPETIVKYAWLIAFVFTLLIFIVVLFTAKTEAHYVVQSSIPDPIMDRVMQLAVCESGYDSTAINRDDGAVGLHSYGILQFQLPTWEHFSKYYGLHGDIHNPEHQKVLAYRMIADERYSHWKICSTKLGFI